MTAFQEHWVRIAERFGLRVQIPFQVDLASERLTVPVLLEEFGAQRGMLLVTSYQDIAAVTEQLVSAGFGYSCLDDSPGTDLDPKSSTCSAIGVGPAVAKRRVGTPPNKPLQRPNAGAVRSEVGRCRDGAGCARTSSRPCYGRGDRLAFAAERQIVIRTSQNGCRRDVAMNCTAPPGERTAGGAVSPGSLQLRSWRLFLLGMPLMSGIRS